jgi:hypothetical protein
MKLKGNIALAALASVLVTTPALAGPFPPPILAVPALDEWGVIGLGLIVGVAGLIALFKRK